ncbi:MAG: hypothetical protein U5Q16_05400 [Gammaproteobacteria bacterium]|nr:hypothetical protein [Gammaproteobacteria bacterium]
MNTCFRLLMAIALWFSAAAALAVERQVLVEATRIDDLPSGSISFAGVGVADVEIATEERDDGVMLFIRYTDSDARHGGTLSLPASAGPYDRFELPDGTDLYRVNPVTGATGYAAPEFADRPTSFTPGYRLSLGYSGVDYETFAVRGPGVQDLPERGQSVERVRRLPGLG